MSGVRPFRRRSALHQRSLHFGPNMTPMVDVVMVLLVFFMASAAFVGPEWFLKGLVAKKAPPPATPGAGVTPPVTPDLRPRPLEITLETAEGGGVVASGLRRVRVPMAEVLDALRVFCEGEDLTKIEVVIRPAPGVAMQDVVRLHEGCERLGLQRVGYGLSSER